MGRSNLRVPGLGSDLSLCFIDHDKRSGTEQRIHGPILGSDEPITVAARVDSGPIVGVESFIIPDKISVRGLEQIAYVRLAHLFWRMSRDLACDPSPLAELPIAWCGIKSTRQMYREMCELPAGINAGELARRIRAFHDDFRGIPLTVSVHGIRFQLATTATQMPEAPQVVSPPLAAAS